MKTLPQDAQKDRPARPQRVKARGVPLGYVEGLNDARTTLGERCVLAHRGWAGENRGFFSILLDGGLDRFFEVIIQPAVLLFRDQLVPNYADQKPLLPQLHPCDFPVELFHLFRAIRIEKRQ